MTSGRAVSARRRRLRRGQCYDGVPDREIFERDHWQCWLCRKVIGKKIRYPHPRSPSIDHEVPLSLGGDDTALNKRAAHLACNIARSNRIEQMPLFGYAVDFVPEQKSCSGCGKPVTGNGQRRYCTTCRPPEVKHPVSMTRAERKARTDELAERATAMRAAGVKWQDISDALSLYGPGSAYWLVHYRDRAA